MAKSSKSSDKANANRVKKAVKKYDTKKSVRENSAAIGGVVAATAKSAARSKSKKKRNMYIVLCIVVVLVAVLALGYVMGWFDTLLGKPSLKLDQTELSVKVGGTAKLALQGDATDIKWTTSDPAIATVKGGEVTGVGVGTAVIKAYVGKAFGECVVTVSEPEAVALEKTEVSVEAGATSALKLLSDSGKVQWSSSNPSIATVDENGVVTAVSAGTVTITASNGKTQATCTITVAAPDPNKLVLNKTTLSLKVGEEETLTLTAQSGVVQWSSSNTSVATVSSTGKVTAISAGAAVIRAENGSSTVECNVTVIANNSDVVAAGDFSVHFLELGNANTGDSVYIKAGETDILIDAGSRAGSAATIGAYVDKYCTDGKLEFVIATHAHEDHISGFVGTNSAKGIFEKYVCENIIQFARTDKNTQIYKDYCTKRDAEVAAGANLYTALDCYNNTNGGKRIYDLTGDGSITMEILYQKFYESKSSDENNYSVCCMITQGDNHYLFTGDLEKDGEESLVQCNPDLPEMVLFKGGHHGSYTASNEVLLSKIKPQYVCVCCCAGNVEYLTGSTQNLDHSFPAQEFVDRVSVYTERVYVTTLGHIKWDESKKKYVNDTPAYSSFNGNIVFSCKNGQITLECSNNNLKLKDTEWFQNNRRMPDAWANGTSMYK